MTEIQSKLKEIFRDSYQYHLKVQPTTHVRVTQGDRWIFASTDEYLKSYDQKKGARTFNRKMQLVRSNEGRKELSYVSKRDGFKLDAGSYIIVFMKHMPKSWKKGIRKEGKRDLNAWKPMKSKPDIDNFYKKLSDSLLKEDKDIWCAGIMKIWIPDEVEEGTYFINVPSIFDSVIDYLKDAISP
jgi:Holliday junction resolvase RusA-like endonuclease